jgi:CheY-like chemotaxis protein
LIDDILDLSRIEAGAVSISPEPVNIVEVLLEVVATLQPMASRAGTHIELAALPPHAATVRADRTRFAQIVMNYGTNAIKYNRPEGSVTISASVASGGFVRVTVADTGHGIPLDKQDKLFQPFQRAGQETGPIEGTGIGLVISKRLAELMGGSVGFRSAPGSGSAFWVDLPAWAGTAVAPGARGAPRAPEDRRSKQRGRVVLYVEDNPANVTFMRDLVSDVGALELVAAPTAEMGIEIARGQLPDAIIMDINLPGMSGLEALQTLRREEATKGIPVIALTAAASERDRQRGLQAGFFRYLTKPVQVDELVAALETLLALGKGN